MRAVAAVLVSAVIGAVFYLGAFTAVSNLRDAHRRTCRIVVFEDQSWTPTNWSVADGFPPPGCRIVIARLGRPE